MKILIFLLTITTICSVQAQNEVINKIEFTSLSRGYFEKIVFTPDSLELRYRPEPGSEEQVTKKRLSPKQWASLMAELEAIQLETIPKLESPSMKRAYDGARHSTIAIYTNTNKYEHGFDDENPDQSLMPLMKCIIKLKKQM